MHDEAVLYLELGLIVVALGLLARLALHMGLSPIPLYLLAGLAVGEGGLLPIITSETFIEVGADLGIILLLLLLGLEYTAGELLSNLKSNTGVGLVDLVSSFLPGFVAGLILDFGVVPALFLGGITYISSSGVAAKLIEDLGWVGNRETPLVLSILVFEDLAMAVILPVLGAIALGGTFLSAAISAATALILVAAILMVAFRHGERLSSWTFSSSDEVNLLTVLGVTLVVAGITERLEVSAAVGAFLVGIGVSGDAARRARELLTPLRDLFAAVFFIFFGLQIDPRSLPPLVVPILLVALVTGLTKFGTINWVGRRRGLSSRSQRRAGAVLLARGEFSIVIAGLAITAGAPTEMTALAAGYVLVMATAGPLVARAVRS
ncbi:MAG TPA: cation:proton antiporter [Acidimicrobiia bacterium]|nr:cation:proton antiporter [Acidimicrobiia bacterium]